MIRSLKRVSIKKQTEETCIRAIQSNYKNLQYVKHQTPIICETALKIDPFALQYVQEKTYDLCMLALKNDGAALQFISEPTEEMIQVAIQQNAFAIQFVRNPTEDHICMAIRQNPCVLSLFPHADSALFLYAMDFLAEKPNSGRSVSGAYCVRYQSPQTKEVAFAAVQRNGLLLKKIQSPWREDSEILATAVQKEPYALKFVPLHCLTEELCWTSIRQDKYCIKFVPREFQTKEMLEFCKDSDDVFGFIEFIDPALLTKSILTHMCSVDGRCIRHISSDKLTYSMCKIAVEQNGEFLEMVPNRFLTSRLLWLALRNYPQAIQFIPDTLKTRRMCSYVVEKIGDLSHIPTQFHTPTLCEKAISICPSSIQHIARPPLKLCYLAILQQPELFLKLPKQMRTSELALAAVERNGRLLESKKVPQTEEICIAAIRNNWRAFFHVRTRTSAIDLEAVKVHPPLIAMIQNPTDEMLGLSKN